MRAALLLFALLATPALAEFKLLPNPPANFNPEAQVVKDKQTMVVFHADSYDISSRMLVEYKKLGDRRSDLVVVVADIKTLSSPLAKKYGVKSVPWVWIYDQQGRLQVEGVAGYTKSLEMISSGR